MLYYDKLKKTSNFKMTRFYYLKCKKKTETIYEEKAIDDIKYYYLQGICEACKIQKQIFTGKDWKVKTKTKENRKKLQIKDIRQFIISNAKNSDRKS